MTKIFHFSKIFLDKWLFLIMIHIRDEQRPKTTMYTEPVNVHGQYKMFDLCFDNPQLTPVSPVYSILSDVLYYIGFIKNMKYTVVHGLEVLAFQ